MGQVLRQAGVVQEFPHLEQLGELQTAGIFTPRCGGRADSGHHDDSSRDGVRLPFHPAPHRGAVHLVFRILDLLCAGHSPSAVVGLRCRAVDPHGKHP